MAPHKEVKSHDYTHGVCFKQSFVQKPQLDLLITNGNVEQIIWIKRFIWANHLQKIAIAVRREWFSTDMSNSNMAELYIIYSREMINALSYQ